MSRSTARRARASSDPVALGHDLVSLRVALRAVGGGIDVVAAGEDQAVQQVEHLVGVCSSRSSGGIIRARPPARWIAVM